MRLIGWIAFSLAGAAAPAQGQERVRARDLGVAPGIFATGRHNAITDVAGVKVGQAGAVEGDSVRTGVTAIVPHGGNLFRERVPAALYVGNGFGKLLGVTQLRELGELETPILLTCTLCVWRAADAMVEWLLEQPGMENVFSVNPVVGETNDGGLNAIRSRPVTRAMVRSALTDAVSGPVREGSVGAGTGTQAFGWKGGIGTASRVLPGRLGGWAVGVLVQSNFGGVLQVAGAPVGKELGRYSFRAVLDTARESDDRSDNRSGSSGKSDRSDRSESADGSIMIVVATDAPLSDRNLERVAARAVMGLARTGSFASNGSGDYVLAFSTAESVRRRPPTGPGLPAPQVADLPNDDMSGLFAAAVEATEEAIYNSMFMATTVESRIGRSEAIPLDRVREVLRKYGIGK